MTLAPPRRRSYSQLDTYLKCPELYMYKYVQRLPEEPSVWSIGGTAFHQVAEWYLLGDLDRDPSTQQLWDAWNRAWDLAYQETLDRNPTADPDVRTWRAANKGREDVGWWKANGFRMVSDFVTWRNTTGKDLTVLADDDRLYLEAKLEVALGGVHMIAIPDALVLDEHGQLGILDYKTGKEPKGSLQLGVYKAAVLEALGMEAVWGLYYMARKAQLVPRDLTAWTPTHIGGMFADFDTRERMGQYPPKPGSHCSYCPFKQPASGPQCSYYQTENA